MTRLSRFLTIVFLGWTALIFGSHPSLMKMDAGLRHIIIRKNHSKLNRSWLNIKTDDKIPVYILAEGVNCQSAILQAGGSIVINLGNMVSAQLPLDAIRSLAQNPGIQQLCLPRCYHRNNDLLTSDIRADQVYAGLSPLSQSYTGAGVIMGIIAFFRTCLNKTRLAVRPLAKAVRT